MKDKFTAAWIKENSVKIIEEYEDGVLTIRGLHYRLVSIGMTNTTKHYNRVVKAMISARRSGLIRYEVFSDRDREIQGKTKYEETVLTDEIERAKDNIENWINYYFKNPWENQDYYPVVLIEKKALLGAFEPICERHSVSLGACKGYPSLTFLSELASKFQEVIYNGKIPLILYFGDYDPSGEDIPRSIKDNLINDFHIGNIILERVLLLESDVKKYNLPPAPIKSGDSRSEKWEGLGQVELDALDPKIIQEHCKNAIEKWFDEEKFIELKEKEEKERVIYRKALKQFVINITE